MALRHRAWPSGGARMAALLCVVSAGVPAGVLGQTFKGMVAEQLSLAPAASAVVMLMRQDGAGDLETVGMTTTDAAGVFSFETPGPGTYRVQADLDGLSSPLSPAVTLDGPDAVEEIALLLPSALLQSAMTCMNDVTDGVARAAIVGTVVDPGADVALPGVEVSAAWRAGDRTEGLSVRSDAAGHYRLCPPSTAGTVGFASSYLGRDEIHGSVEIDGPSVVIHDLELSVGAVSDRTADVVRDRILTEAAAATLADLSGVIRDRERDAPLPHTVVRLNGTRHQTVSDAEGRFRFADLTPGDYTLEIRSLGYAVVSEPVDVPKGKSVFLDLAVAPQAVELEGLEVTARSPGEQVSRATPFRRSIVYGAVMAEEQEKGARLFEVLRRSAPVRVREIWRDLGPPIVCVETNRRLQSFREGFVGPNGALDQRPDESPLGLMEEDAGCQNVQVVVDGIKIPDGANYLQRTPATEIESIEFLSPVHAQITYGIGGDTANGVVVVHSRGNGPYASPLRNRDPGGRR